MDIIHGKIKKQISKLKVNQQSIVPLFSFDSKIEQRLCTCSDTVLAERYENIETLEQKNKYISAKTCQLRFCPLCNFYRVCNLTPQIVSELERLKKLGKELLFLTLTVPNCSFDSLRQTIQRMNKSFAKMVTNNSFKGNVTHWIRTTEVTFKYNEAHPHFHCILAVERDYFKHRNYLRTSDWSKLWTRCYKSSKGLIVDARAIRQKNAKKDAIQSAVAELSKYVIKSSDLKKLDKAKMEVVYRELKNLRFIATSRNVKLDEDKDQVFDHELWRLIETIVYRYSSKAKQYEMKKVIKPN